MLQHGDYVNRRIISYLCYQFTPETRPITSCLTVYKHANLMWIMGWRIAKHVLFFGRVLMRPEIIKQIITAGMPRPNWCGELNTEKRGCEGPLIFIAAAIWRGPHVQAEPQSAFLCILFANYRRIHCIPLRKRQIHNIRPY